MISQNPNLAVEIDLETEELLTLGQACKFFPQRPSPTTLWRWRTIGVNGVKLRVVKCGSRWLTSKRAVLEFIRVQTLAAQA